MNRRALLQLLAVGVPGLAGLSADRLAALEQRMAAVPRRRRGLFNPQQFETVDQLSEIIIPATDTPGAHAAGVAAFIEHIVADWYDHEERQVFLKGLADVDARSVRISGKAFVDAPDATRQAVVTELESTISQDDTSGFWSRFKALTLYGFFNSEPGVRQVLETPFMPGFYDGDAPVGGPLGGRN